MNAARDAVNQAPCLSGRLQFAGIANGRPVPIEAMRGIDLWTG